MKKNNFSFTFGVLLGIFISTFLGSISFAAEELSVDLCGPPSDGKVWVIYEMRTDWDEDGIRLCIQQDKNSKYFSYRELVQGKIIDENLVKPEDETTYFYLGIDFDIIKTGAVMRAEGMNFESSPLNLNLEISEGDAMVGSSEAVYTYAYSFDVDSAATFVMVFIERGTISTKEEWCKLKPNDRRCVVSLKEGAGSMSVEVCEEMKKTYSFPACGSEWNKLEIDFSQDPELMDLLIQGVFDDGGSIKREDLEALIQCTNIAYQECLRSIDKENQGKDEEKKNVFVIPNVSGLNKMGSVSVPTVIGRAIKGALSVMGSIAFVMYMYGGVLYMTAAGNSSKEAQSKKILVWTTLGILVILSSYIIVDFIFGAFRL